MSDDDYRAELKFLSLSLESTKQALDRANALIGATADECKKVVAELEARQRAVCGCLEAIRLQSQPGSHNSDNAINALKILRGEIPASNLKSD